MYKFLLPLFFLAFSLDNYSQGSLQVPLKNFESFKLDKDTCNKITTSSGSLIFIEANAIKSSTNTVEIRYREFFSPLDMFIHGIRMHTQFGDDKFQLESTGMFELYAFDGDDTLSLNPGKRIEVRMAIEKETNLSGIESYRYNGNHWDNYGSPVNKNSIRDDNALWGSSAIESFAEEAFNELEFSGGFSSMDDSNSESVRNAFQSMQITDFGLFNYDRMIEGVERIPVEPHFITENKKINKTIYVVYNDINSVYYFPHYTWENDFFLLKGKSYKLFTIENDGRISRLIDYPASEALADRKHTFSLVVQPEIPIDKQSLSALTGIQ